MTEETEKREARLSLWLEQFGQDLRYGLRTLIKCPGFAAMAVLTLALGIGANTAMFSVIDGVLLTPLPFQEPSRVAIVWQRQANGRDNIFSTPDFLEWKMQAGPVEHMAALSGDGHVLGTKDQVERVSGWKASAEMFSVFGVSPALGRPFTADEDRPGAGKFVVLSDGLWKTHFLSNPNVLGTKVDFDGVPYTVIGVMPPGFQIFSNNDQFWTPLQLETQTTAAASRTSHWLFVVTRLPSGATLQQSQSALDAVAARFHHDDPTGDAGFGVSLHTFQEIVTGNIRGPLLLLMGCVGCVLLIACSNVANLLLARGTARRMEISIRSAVGAQRSRVVRQLLTESVLLSLLGGVFGLLLAYGSLKVLLALNPAIIPNVATIAINVTVLGFTLAVCLGVGMLFGIAPALASSRVDLSNALREASRGASRSSGRYRTALVVIETALASMLLIGAGLSLKSLWKVTKVDPGFNPSGLLTFVVSAPESAKDRPYVFYQQIADRVRALPGVQSVALARDVPLNGNGTDPSMPVAVDGHVPQITNGQVVTRFRVIGPDYFHAFQTPVLRGREFTAAETATSQPVVIVSESLAQRYWPNQDPIGRSLRPDLADAPWYTVVGVVADVRHLALDQDTEPTAYYPYTQVAKSDLKIIESYMTVTVRSGTSTTGLLDSLRRAVAGVDKSVPLFAVKPVEELLADAGSLRRFNMWLLGAFAGLALILAAIGVYGVMAYSVLQRTREIGIRMALGAKRSDVMRLIVMHGAKMALAGVGIGVAAAFALTRLMAALLYQVSPTDVWTFAGVSLTVLAFILLACYVPSRRATRVDPNVALRSE